MTLTRALLLVLALGFGASLSAAEVPPPAKPENTCAACTKDKVCDPCAKKAADAKKAAEGKKAGGCGGCGGGCAR